LLFDYDTVDYTYSSLEIKSNGLLLRNDKKIKFEKGKALTNETIGAITIKGDEYTLKLENTAKILEERNWMVIRNTIYKEEAYKLKQNDIIKFGKIAFMVKELRVDKHTTESKVEEDIPEYNFDFKKHSKCRICLMEDNEQDNPLIRLPCKCRGSMKSIHLICMQQWLRSKITTKSLNFLTVHSFKNIECEICKQSIPEKIKFRNEVISFVDYDKPDGCYIILESLSNEKRETRHVYIINMKEKKNMKIGRANDADVRMTDISISRNHAELKLKLNGFYLEDNASKFGTLLQLQSDVLFLPNKNFALQSGRIYITITLKRTFIGWLLCYHNKALNEFDYNNYFEKQIIAVENNIVHKFDMVVYLD
jgi:hypothetical protein